MQKKILITVLSIIIVSGASVGLYFLTMPTIYTTVNNVVVLSGHPPSPNSFLAFCENSSDVTTQFASDTNWNVPGQTEVTLTLTKGRRTTHKNAYVYILEPIPYVEAEIATPVELITPQAFLRYAPTVPVSALFEVEILTPVITEFTGQYPVEILLNGSLFTSMLHIIDTTPPTATTVNNIIPMGEVIHADSFVTDIFDHSLPVMVQFANGTEPNIFQPGSQNVDITLTDYYGNTAVYTAQLTVLPNTAPPRLVGAGNITIVIDSPAMFRFGVSAYDAFSRPIDFTVDSSNVDTTTLGVYYLTYRAEDCCGNYVEETVRVYVINVDPEEVRARAAAVLDRILRDDMTQVQEARAIFDWITANVGYAAGFEHRTVYESANQALVHRRGDCFVFYSISELLLTMAGIPNMRIDRVGGRSRHAWNLINPDDLGWHHFDSTPLRVRQLNRFMFTQTQAEQFTRTIQAEGQGSGYFNFDPDLYPEIVR